MISLFKPEKVFGSHQDNILIVCAKFDNGYHVEFWNVENPQKPFKVVIFQNVSHIHYVSISPSKEFFSIGYTKKMESCVALYQFSSADIACSSRLEKEVLTRDGNIHCLSPDGKTIAYIANKKLIQSNVGSGQILSHCPQNYRPEFIEYTDSGEIYQSVFGRSAELSLEGENYRSGQAIKSLTSSPICHFSFFTWYQSARIGETVYFINEFTGDIETIRWIMHQFKDKGLPTSIIAKTTVFRKYNNENEIASAQ